MKNLALLIFMAMLPAHSSRADIELSLLQRKAQCLIATHPVTKITRRQILMSGVYSIYPYVTGSGSPDGMDGGILYTKEKVYYLELKPAIELLRASNPDASPTWFGGWIILTSNNEHIYAKYSAHYFIDESPLTITNTPLNAPHLAPIVEMKEVLETDRELMEKIGDAFDVAIDVAELGVIAKLKLMSKTKKKAVLNSLAACSGVSDFSSYKE
jgi:hypothetical protein